MIELIQYGFMQKALLGGLAIAIACALLGPFLVLRRQSLLSDGLAHVAFGGVALGLLFGISPIVSALVAVIIGSLVLQRMLRENAYDDALIAVILSLGIGLGVIAIGIAKGFTVDLFSYLIGSILTLSTLDVLFSYIILASVLFFVGSFYNHLMFLTFNPRLASLHLKNLSMVQTLFSVLIALVVILSIRAVGILLVTALIVLPALIGLSLGSSFRTTLLYSVFASLLCVLIGIASSFYLDVPPSGLIVMLLFCVFVVASFVKK